MLPLTSDSVVKRGTCLHCTMPIAQVRDPADGRMLWRHVVTYHPSPNQDDYEIVGSVVCTIIGARPNTAAPIEKTKRPRNKAARAALRRVPHV